MRAWALLIAGLVIWAAHFFALYGIASVLPGRRADALWFVLAATVFAVAANVLVLRRLRARPGHADEVNVWVTRVASLGAIFSVLAVLWQTVPVLIP